MRKKQILMLTSVILLMLYFAALSIWTTDAELKHSPFVIGLGVALILWVAYSFYSLAGKPELKT